MPFVSAHVVGTPPPLEVLLDDETVLDDDAAPPVPLGLLGHVEAPQTVAIWLTHWASQLLVQQYESAAHIAAEHASHEDESALPVEHGEWSHAAPPELLLLDATLVLEGPLVVVGPVVLEGPVVVVAGPAPAPVGPLRFGLPVVALVAPPSPVPVLVTATLDSVDGPPKDPPPASEPSSPWAQAAVKRSGSTREVFRTRRCCHVVRRG